MSPANAATPELSDDERPTSPTSTIAYSGSSSRRRSSRACDQCRRTKSKCEPSDLPGNVCRACATLGVSCTYAAPSHKRGPPKGYILALERRLHQVEALLGTIVASDDPRARSLVEDLTQDQLASHIIRRVKIGPFGPRGRLQQPFGSTKEDFLASIMIGASDDGHSLHQEENLALISPDRDWQDRLQKLISSRSTSQQSGGMYPQQMQQQPYHHLLRSNVPSTVPSPAPPHQQYQMSQQPHPLSVSFPSAAKMESEQSPSMMLAQLPPYQSHSSNMNGYGRPSWDAQGNLHVNGLQRMDDAVLHQHHDEDGRRGHGHGHSQSGQYDVVPDPNAQGQMGPREYHPQAMQPQRHCQDSSSSTGAVVLRPRSRWLNADD